MSFGANYFGQPYVGQGWAGAIAARDTIDLTGSFIPMLSIDAEFIKALDLIGELAPLSVAGEDVEDLDLTGDYWPVLETTAGTFGVNIMAIHAVLGGTGKMFVGEDKVLRLTGVTDEEGALIDISGWTIHFVGGPFTKTASITGTFNVDPELNTQMAIVTLTAAETAASLQPTQYPYSWKRVDAGFNDILAYGTWPVQKTTQ